MMLMISNRALQMSVNSWRIIQLYLIYGIGKVILVLGFYDDWLLEEGRVHGMLKMRSSEMIWWVGLHTCQKKIYYKIKHNSRKNSGNDCGSTKSENKLDENGKIKLKCEWVFRRGQTSMVTERQWPKLVIWKNERLKCVHR